MCFWFGVAMVGGALNRHENIFGATIQPPFPRRSDWLDRIDPYGRCHFVGAPQKPLGW